jgi:hypothetical protein
MKMGRQRKIEARASEQDRPDEWYSDNQESGPEREKGREGSSGLHVLLNADSRASAPRE